MDFLVGLLVLAVPTLALGVILRRRQELVGLGLRPYREGEVRPWETEAVRRADRRRINALLEEELIRRAA
ncbi:MAG: hypothetical protein HYZ11_09775 [Candidatus Tectomicrobia bacterium]|uniref:Uncharacterized protein n=1 Tax=Tectimicrobiota bacterium TaxID=2528274 RepID=A0A932I0W7_UNCTE|nr:hypothetical protein [Candidatus Tectomicrobia bacterium]